MLFCFVLFSFSFSFCFLDKKGGGGASKTELLVKLREQNATLKKEVKDLKSQLEALTSWVNGSLKPGIKNLRTSLVGVC